MKRKLLFWTKEGLTSLGKIIRASRETQCLTLVDAAALIEEKTGKSIGFRTLASIETAVGEPKYNTLVAIAYAGFVKLNGRVLNIFDFIAIASESYEAINMDALADLIEAHLAKNELSLHEFSQSTGVGLADLEEILRRKVPIKTAYDQETDLILLAGHLINPTTGRTFHSYLELVDYCGMSRSASGNWVQAHCSS